MFVQNKEKSNEEEKGSQRTIKDGVMSRSDEEQWKSIWYQDASTWSTCFEKTIKL